jgi:transcriptional regulator with XRE-family HTH domain
VLFRGARDSQGAKARRLGIAQPYASQLCTASRLPGDELRQRIADAYGVPPSAWDEELSPEEVPNVVVTSVRKESVPEHREQATPCLPNEIVLPEGAVVDRARALLAYLSTPGLNQRKLAQARELRHALTLEARLVGAMSTKAKLHEHPDWAAHMEQLVAALGKVPGALDALESCLARPEEQADGSAAA